MTRHATIPTMLRMTVIIPLDSVLAHQGGELTLDRNEIEARLQTVKPAPAHAVRLRPRKRASRTALVELLRHEIEEHLRSARDYAHATYDRTGTPLLLPRPSMEQLAKRLRVNKSTISRCLRDRAAGPLRTLWDLAADLDRLLGAAGERS
jgi:hypothetical protein